MEPEFYGMDSGTCRESETSLREFIAFYRDGFQDLYIKALNVEWVGEDYDAFLEKLGRCKEYVDDAVARYERLADELITNCEEQDRASEPDDNPFPFPWPFPR